MTVTQQIKVTQVKSTTGHNQNIRRVMVALGLKGISSSNTLKDNNCIRGMVNKVKHLVTYELI